MNIWGSPSLQDFLPKMEDNADGLVSINLDDERYLTETEFVDYCKNICTSIPDCKAFTTWKEPFPEATIAIGTTPPSSRHGILFKRDINAMIAPNDRKCATDDDIEVLIVRDVDPLKIEDLKTYEKN